MAINLCVVFVSMLRKMFLLFLNHQIYAGSDAIRASPKQ